VTTPLLFLRDIHLTFGVTPLLEGADLSVTEGERLCLVGRNGSGKSTLLKITAGLTEADGGTRFVQPGVTVRYLPQEPDFSDFATVRAFVEAGMAPGDDPHRAQYLLSQLGLSGDEATDRLSGGEARRAALVRVLAPSPDILLLDEPTNHLDLPAIEWLESELAAMRSAIVLVSHDRRFLGALSNATLWLDRGRTRLLDRGFEAFEAWRDNLIEEEELEQHKIDRKIAMEEHWVRYGVTARRKRNQRRLAQLFDLRRQRREHRRVAGTVRMSVGDTDNSGTRVVEAKDISKSYGDRAIVRDVSMRIHRGDRLGIVGANGAGKTTLLNLLIGRLAPDSGTVTLGSNLLIASLDQGRASLNSETSLRDVLTGGRGDTVTVAGQSRHVMSYMKDFLFAPEQARTPVSVLSGGERGRLLLAKTLALPSNLLVLDEPTNDLDLETLDLLQEMIADYPGTVILISHDRDFLDRIVTSIVMAEGDGRFVEYAGGYTDMVAQRGEGVSAKPAAKVERSKAPQSGPAAVAAPKRRLTFKDQHALKDLPIQMARMEKEIATLQAELADDTLYARDPDRFAQAATELAKRRSDLTAAEDRWLEIEALREEIERSP
jgi:ABC transport system ATP-binding/permease protein